MGFIIRNIPFRKLECRMSFLRDLKDEERFGAMSQRPLHNMGLGFGAIALEKSSKGAS